MCVCVSLSLSLSLCMFARSSAFVLLIFGIFNTCSGCSKCRLSSDGRGSQSITFRHSFQMHGCAVAQSLRLGKVGAHWCTAELMHEVGICGKVVLQKSCRIEGFCSMNARRDRCARPEGELG